MQSDVKRLRKELDRITYLFLGRMVLVITKGHMELRMKITREEFEELVDRLSTR